MNYKFLGILSICLVVLIPCIVLQNDVMAFTIPNPSKTNTSFYLKSQPMIGIQLSQTCINMEKNQMKSGCMTYDQIQFFDNTNPVWAGAWVNDTWYHRLPPRVQNHEIMNTNKFVIMVDPNPGFTARSKMIIVQSQGFTWINPGDIVKNNRVQLQYVDRYMSGCDSAIVAPDISLIADTIIYLENGCTKTNFNGTKKSIITDHPFSMDNPYSSLLQKSYVTTILKGQFVSSTNHTIGGLGPSNCINFKCYLPKNPFANW